VKLAPEELGHTCDADIAAEPVDGPGTGVLVSRDVPDVSPAPPRRLAHSGFQRTRANYAAPGNRGAHTQSTRRARRPIRPYRSVVAYYTWKVSADPDPFATSSVRAVR
jgi:hypothetical protein